VVGENENTANSAELELGLAELGNNINVCELLIFA
jgi:hypothetical protein